MHLNIFFNLERVVFLKVILFKFVYKYFDKKRIIHAMVFL